MIPLSQNEIAIRHARGQHRARADCHISEVQAEMISFGVIKTTGGGFAGVWNIMLPPYKHKIRCLFFCPTEL